MLAFRPALEVGSNNLAAAIRKRNALSARCGFDNGVGLMARSTSWRLDVMTLALFYYYSSARNRLACVYAEDKWRSWPSAFLLCTAGNDTLPSGAGEHGKYGGIKNKRRQ